MQKKIIQLTKKPFIRNVIVLASGTAVAQVITMALSPIITRLYGPEAFGLMGTFMAIVNIIVPIAALTYPIAIVLPEKDQDAKGLIRLSLLISTILSTVSLMILILFNKLIIDKFNLKVIYTYLFFITFDIIFTVLIYVYDICNH